MRLRAHRSLFLLVTASVGAAGLAITLAVPAQATPPAAFDAPIFGTTATLTGARLPSIADIQCSDEACTTGVLPASLLLYPSVYFSTTVATGASLSVEPGFVAAVNEDWYSLLSKGGGEFAQFALQFAEFAPGTDLAATVAHNIAGYAGQSAGPLTGPTSVDGQQTWTLEDNTNPELALRFAYAANGTMLVRTMCGFTPAMAAKNPCGLASMVAITVATANRPAPRVFPIGRAMRSLIPTTPANLTPVMLSVENSPPVWGATIAGPALTKLLQPTRTAILQ
jgi:hypothetical protein